VATTIIRPDNDAVVSEIKITVPPQRVFDALIDPKQMMSWWTCEEGRAKTFTLDPRIGGKWTYDSTSARAKVNGVRDFHCEGEVVEFDPPRLLAYTWVANWHDDRSRRTVVRYELIAEEGGTRVRVTHSGLAEEASARKDYSGGWLGVLRDLKKFVEK
jgi:uncharacterized protein YndB with AHSA1/START domain